MRLIHTQKVEFEEYLGGDIPPYAILSHTWDAQEVSFQNFGPRDVLQSRKGGEKVLKTCEVALRDGYQRVWIDSACINKESSAELTEAINSMFNWYKRSSQCYVYLGDFDCQDPGSDFSRCRWFSRGWTLQELIAPSKMQFLDKNWKIFGSKHELKAALSTITGIERSVLFGLNPLHNIPAAQKMSWAAKRQTTREEDIAYSLLGIFNISMPLVYGEGGRAFIRLQEEILKASNDLTIFAWQAAPESMAATPYRGVLARSPKEFVNAGTTISTTNHKQNPEFAMTNKGLRIHTDLHRGPSGSVIMSLNCRRQPGQGTIGIYLTGIGGGVFARDLPYMLASSASVSEPTQQLIYIMKDVEDAQYL